MVIIQSSLIVINDVILGGIIRIGEPYPSGGLHCEVCVG